VTLLNTARTTPFEVAVAAQPAGEGEPGPAAERPPRGNGAEDGPASDGPEAEGLDADGAPSAPERSAERAPRSGQGGNGQPASVQPAAQARGGPVLELRIANTGGQGARLRAAPSLAADLIAILPDGAVVQAIGLEAVVTEERWRHVRAPSGAVGWVAADLLAPASDASE
jgi:hypothetical protein